MARTKYTNRVIPPWALRLRAAREAIRVDGKRLSQTALAGKLGTTQRQIVRWETGENEPEPYWLGRLADELGIDPSVIRPDPEDAPSFEDRLADAIADRVIQRLREMPAGPVSPDPEDPP